MAPTFHSGKKLSCYDFNDFEKVLSYLKASLIRLSVLHLLMIPDPFLQMVSSSLQSANCKTARCARHM
jgi:hypothetical protein